MSIHSRSWILVTIILLSYSLNDVLAQQKDVVWTLKAHSEKNTYRMGEPILMPPPAEGNIGIKTKSSSKPEGTYADFQIAREVQTKQVQERVGSVVDPRDRGKSQMSRSSKILLGYALKTNQESLRYSDYPLQWEFVFPERGKYDFEILYYSQNVSRAKFLKDVLKSYNMEIVIEDHKDEEDKMAWELYTPYAAGAYLGEYEGKYGTEGIAALKKILSEYPDSFYAPYAAIGLARRSKGQKIEELLLPLKDKHLDHPAFSEAATMLVEMYIWQHSCPK